VDLDAIKTNRYSHIHIAGYYNIPKFWNGALKSKLAGIQNQRGSNSLTSLTPQFDSTQQWDGGIRELLPHVNFVIMSQSEAENITRCKDENLMAKFFHSISPSTYAIVTKGAEGAIVLHNSTILHKQNAQVGIRVIDTTGAGDAFAAGFIHGFWMWKSLFSSSVEIENEAVINGVQWGCALGTACATTLGASSPSGREEILSCLT